MLLVKITTKVYKDFGGLRIMDKERIEKRLEKLILPGAGLVWRGVIGTIDVLTTGLPLLSGYLEASTLLKLDGIGDSKYNPFAISGKEIIVSQLSYLSGVAIPFAIKYQNEIYNFVEGVFK
jgi:hypothetical protein